MIFYLTDIVMTYIRLVIGEPKAVSMSECNAKINSCEVQNKYSLYIKNELSDLI